MLVIRTNDHPSRGILMLRVRVTFAMATAFVVGIGLCAPRSVAQVATNGLNILVGDDTVLPGESTTVRLEAYFGGSDYAVAGVATWLHSSAGAVGLSEPRLVAPMNGPGTSPGFLGETGVRGVLAGQLNFHSVIADPTNPMAFWEVTYTAPADAAGPLDIRLETRTSRFDVYYAREISASQSRLDDFADGLATIHVIPAPAGALVLGGLLLTPRRRRAAAVAMGLCASAAFGQTMVGGVIDTDTIWTQAESPYVVTETIQVTGDATLTISPNVEVQFNAGNGMVVGPGGSGGTGALHAVGADRARVFFNGGTGLVFGPNAVPAVVDPVTGGFVSGSTVQWASIGNTAPAAGVGGRYAMRLGATPPHMDNVTFFSLSAGAGAIYADLTIDPEASLRWGAIRLSNYFGSGLYVRGGREHVIRSFSAVDVSKIDRLTTLVEGFVATRSTDGWDLEIQGGFVENCTAERLFSLERDHRVRFQDLTIEGCEGTVIVGSNLGAMEVVGCRFVDNGVNVDVGVASCLVLDCDFIQTRDVRGVDISGRGSIVVEDCLFESNAGPALYPSGNPTIVRQCRFIGNTGGVGPGAVFAGPTTDLVDNYFERNSAVTGGAVATSGALTKGNTYIGNSATFGGAIAAGRVSYIGMADAPEVFIGNTATQSGGAIYVSGAGVDIVAARFERNTAESGGAVAAAELATGLSMSLAGGTGTTMLGNTAARGADISIAAPAGSGEILAPCIDWGTRDAAAIAGRIYDGGDDPALAVVRFEPIGPCACRVDLDGDGALTIFDFLAFQTAFDAGDLSVADFDGDGALTLFDFLAFQTEFDAGCP
jgi:predicted outer membrane repeat protein